MSKRMSVLGFVICAGVIGCGGDGDPDRGTDCVTPEVDCGGVCVDTSSDSENCGACADAGGDVCVGEEVCSIGACELDCAPGLIECGSSCIDPQTDSTYCGADAACSGGVACAAGESCETGVCIYRGGCVDESSEVVWSDDVHGCGGPTQTWLLYSEEQATYCMPGWVLAGEDIVNSVLVDDAYTDDVQYAFNGEGCEAGDAFSTRHDASSQDRAACSWLVSHHDSIDEDSDVQGIVCQRQPGAVEPRYTGPAGTDHSAAGWVLCGHAPIAGGTLVDPRSTDGLGACLRRGLRPFMVERSTGICQTGDQLGWEYPDDMAEVTLDWHLTNRTNGGWISPSYAGTNTCGVRSFEPWNTTTGIESYDNGPLVDGESWIYYQQ